MKNSTRVWNTNWRGFVNFSIVNWIEGSDRHQTQLLPVALEDYVGPDNPLRFLDAFIGTLDLRAAGFQFPKEDPQGRGRPAYQPADLLKL